MEPTDYYQPIFGKYFQIAGVEFDFPKELFLKVLNYLEPKELCTASLVQKSWKPITEDQNLWMDLSERDFLVSEFVENAFKCWKEFYKRRYSYWTNFDEFVDLCQKRQKLQVPHINC